MAKLQRYAESGIHTVVAPPRRRHAWLSRTLRIVGRGALVLCVVSLMATWLGWLWLSHTVTTFAGPHFNQGQNAVWLEHTWAGDAHTLADYDQLAHQLRQEQIGYVFAHVGPLASSGAIPPDRFGYAAALVRALKQRVPGIKVLAWIGQLDRASGQPADQTVDIANPDTRQTIAAAAAYFAGPLAFDGVHFDIEPMENNDAHFLDLLDTTRAALPHGKLISTSAPMWAPNAHLAQALQSTLGKGAGLWTSYYYAAVATHVDQLVVMEYNTAIPSGALYALYVKQQAQNILAAVRSARTPPQVLIGLPSYQESGFWFHADAENVTNGLAGVINGLNADTDTQPFAGVAIYRFATTDDAAWRAYQQLWLGQPG